jgi:hypothetical protein
MMIPFKDELMKVLQTQSMLLRAAFHRAEPGVSQWETPFRRWAVFLAIDLMSVSIPRAIKPPITIPTTPPST